MGLVIAIIASYCSLLHQLYCRIEGTEYLTQITSIKINSKTIRRTYASQSNQFTFRQI